MIYNHLVKKQKTIAWLLYLLFSSELILGAKAAMQMPGHFGSAGISCYTSAERLQAGFNNPMPEKNDLSVVPVSVNASFDDKANVVGKDIVKQEDVVKQEGSDKESGGPGQPEMATFKSVGVDKMVNSFTGDFSYNIPLLDVGGYPVNIFYNAGISMEQEATWVGLGWNINPGNISRNMRGLPDDFNGDGGDYVTKEQSVSNDETVGVSLSKGFELVGKPINLDASIGVKVNNKLGVSLSLGGGAEFKMHKDYAHESKDEKTKKDTSKLQMTISTSLNLDSRDGVTASLGFQGNLFSALEKAERGLSTSIDYNSMRGLGELKFDYQFKKANDEGKVIDYGSWISSSLSFARPSYTPSIRMISTNYSGMLAVKLGKENRPIFKNWGLQGFYSNSTIRGKDKISTKYAYGFMYMDRVFNKETGTTNEDALMDFNRVNDRVYSTKTPIISAPVLTYDVFNISGEGTGGSFRGYRGSVGYVKDNKTTTKSGSGGVAFDIGVKNKAHVGATLNGAFTTTTAGEWKLNNTMKKNLQFERSNENYEGFYFRNPDEKAIIDEGFYNALGGDKLIRPTMGLEGGGIIYNPTPFLQSKYEVFNDARQKESDLQVSGLLRKNPDNRDKRTQLISFLTASEAAVPEIGLDSYIWDYQENVFKPGSCTDLSYKRPLSRVPEKRKILQAANPISSLKKNHHISEITVLEGDAKRYVYGLPVYTKMKKEVSFSVLSKLDQPVDNKNEVSILAGQNSIDNNSNLEKFYQSETVSSYAGNFLLTAILSPDYMDVKGDGITDDDLGTAVKFNYSFANRLSADNFSFYKWRYPFGNKASFNDGLKTDYTDNKANYTYGEKELWYLHSIETKNMVVTFKVSKREDGWGVSSENGGTLSNTVCQRKLDRIDLYTKADFVKYHKDPVNHKLTPVKSVFFEYDYTLCPNYPFNGGRSLDKNGNTVSDPNSETNVNKNMGKLTLKSIWFTYNGSNKKQGVYKFKYGTTKNEVNLNPSYNTTETDRWGNYKQSIINPSNPSLVTDVPLMNADYSYATQDPLKANAYASAWNLEKILLPSGAVISVDYEADSYSYVQDKKAAVATPILGFGRAPQSTPSNKIYGADGLSPGDITSNAANMDYRYVYFKLNTPSATITKKEVYNTYLRGIKQLLMKVWIKVKNDGRGEGYEPVFIYAPLSLAEDGDWYGLRDQETTGPDQGKYTSFYIRMEATHQNGSPVVQTVFDFVRRNLPSKVYPGYSTKAREQGNLSGIAQVGRALWGMADQVVKAVTGFEASLKSGGHFSTVALPVSTARLNAPLSNNTKFGGGHRVKKITIKDSWDELTKLPGGSKPEKASEYGQEYEYTSEEEGKVISSGVAAYEPGVGSDENPFREVYQWKEKQPLGPTQYDNIELPVAEVFFPAPMVGYSRVTVKSIHNRSNKTIKSGIGKQVSEFYTTRDFPVITDFTPFDDVSRRSFKPSPLATFMNLKQTDLLSLTQGFRVILNDMNGKPKASISYPEGDDKTIINSTRYFYRTTKVGENKYRLNNIVPVIANAKGEVVNKMIGKDIELMNDSRDHYTYTYSGQLPINTDIFTVGGWPVILPSLFRMAFKDESLFRSFSTMKVVNEYGILERIENNDKGSIVNTENMVYDGETGDVLVTKTNNEFKQPVYNVSYPAHWFETGMAPAYKNIDVQYDNVTFRKGRLEGVPSHVFNLFESGDELFVTATKAPPALGCVNPGEDCEGLPLNPARRIWALDIRKDPNNPQETKDFIFIDREGNPYNGAGASFRIIRSGHRNLIGVSVGSAQSKENPVVANQLAVNDGANVVNAGAVLFKERWRVNDNFYTEKEWTTSQSYAEIKTVTLYPTDDHVTTKSYDQFNLNAPIVTNDAHNGYFVSSHRSGSVSGAEGLHNSETRSWMKFDLSSLPVTSTITSASLLLIPHSGSPGHGAYDNHNYTNPHIRHPWDNLSSFRFHIDRMKSAWPSTISDDAWGNTIFNQFATGPEPMLIVNPEPNGRWPYDFSNASYNVSVTALVRGMSLNRNTQQPAFAIRHVSRAKINEYGSRLCFGTFLDLPNPPPPPDPNDDVLVMRTALTIKYYDCDTPVEEDFEGPKIACAATSGYTTVCKSIYTRSFINPYVQGLLGNWRPWRNYTFYGERRQTLEDGTAIYKDGVIKDFEPYWILPTVATEKIQPVVVDIPANTISKWVWNTEVQMYNRKGAQLQDHDPLERFNAAIFGYQESLPVAAISNSKLRESAFDGFEDYGYADDPCEPFCKPARRHFTTSVTESMLDDKESHTGLYSLKVAGGTTYDFTLPVSADNNNYNPETIITVQKTTNSITQYDLAGAGIAGTQYEFKCLDNFLRDNTLTQLDYRREGNRRESSVYKGKIIVNKTGTYVFRMSFANDFASLFFDGDHPGGVNYGTSNPFLHYHLWKSNCNWEFGPQQAERTLVAGQAYPITIIYNNRKSNNGDIGFTVQWKKPCDSDFEVVKTPYLYKTGQATPPGINTNLTCYNPSEITAGQPLIETFSLIPGKKMLVSVWVKKGGQDCKCNNYTGINIQVKRGLHVLGTLSPVSKIIEGWQLFEGEFTVSPPPGILLHFSVQTSGSDPFYLDDLRIHPFNSNMKSMVYDARTLWLTAELDENNYASFYEYDDDGTLVRVKKETKDGVKTIKETRSAIQGKIENF